MCGYHIMKKNSQIKSIGNVNNIDDFCVDNATITNLTATNATITNLTVPNIVTSSSTLTANNLIKGDTGAKTVKTTGVTVDSSDNVTLPSASTLKANLLSETTTSSGITIVVSISY